MNLLYLVGPPAAGKSTLMAALTAGCQRVPVWYPVPHDILVEPAHGVGVGVELGRIRERFSGTDALPLNVAVRARAWLAEPDLPRYRHLVLAEGDRLAHAGFLDGAANAGYQVTLAYLTASDETLDARCEARGSRQSYAWRRGRATKSRRLGDYAQAQHTLVSLDGERCPADLVADLRAALPALDALPDPRP